MNLPMKFPSDAEVILEEVARFRALSPESRMRSIRGLLAAGALMMRRSPKAAFLRDYILEQRIGRAKPLRSSLHAMPAENDLLGNELIRAVELLADTFTAQSIRYAVVGGLATALRGRPRFTQDVHVLLDVPQLALPGLFDELGRLGFGFDRAKVIREYVREHMTAFRFGSVRIDWLKPVLPLYARTLAEASFLTWTEGHPLRVATAEGLILTKMVSFRPQDQADIETVLIANRDDLDVVLIRQEWSAVAAGEEARTAWLEDAVARLVPP